MARAVKEWVGKTDDTPVPRRVKDRMIIRQDWRCADCYSLFGPRNRPQFDHRPALINGGENRETKMRAVCAPCHALLTGADVAEKAKVARTRKKHLGVTKSKRSLSAPNPKAWKYDWQAGRYVRIA